MHPAEAEVPCPDQGPRLVASGGPADMTLLTAVVTKEGPAKIIKMVKGPAKGKDRAAIRAAAKHKGLQQQQGSALGDGAVAQTGSGLQAAAQEPPELLKRKGKGKASAPAGGGFAQTSSQPATSGQAAPGVRRKSKTQQHQDPAPAGSKPASPRQGAGDGDAPLGADDMSFLQQLAQGCSAPPQRL